jgi:hypothetical protein
MAIGIMSLPVIIIGETRLADSAGERSTKRWQGGT